MNRLHPYIAAALLALLACGTVRAESGHAGPFPGEDEMYAPGGSHAPGGKYYTGPHPNRQKRPAELEAEIAVLKAEVESLKAKLAKRKPKKQKPVAASRVVAPRLRLEIDEAPPYTGGVLCEKPE